MSETLADVIERRCRERPDLSSAQIADALDCRPEYVRVVAKRRGFTTNGGRRPQSAISAAVRAERERCAGIAESEAERIDADRGLSGDSAIALSIAAAIRSAEDRESDVIFAPADFDSTRIRAQLDEARGALEEIAKQHLPEEIIDDDDPDYELGYDMAIRRARAFLEKTEGE